MDGGGAGARALFRSLAAAGRVLPLPALRVLSRSAAAVLSSASPRLRCGLERNAVRLLGPLASSSSRRALARAQLRSFADFAAEISALERDGEGVQGLLAGVEGAENLARAEAAGRGLVAVTLHLGNYELAGAALAARIGAKVAVLYDEDPAGAWEDRRTRWRRRAGLAQIAINASRYFGIEALALLRSGGAVLLAGDQVESRGGERYTFLGAPARFSLLPASLSRAAGSPLLPAFAVREPSGSYRLHLERPIFPGERDPGDLTAELIEVYGSYLRRYPEQWLMVRPFWCEDSGSALRLP